MFHKIIAKAGGATRKKKAITVSVKMETIEKGEHGACIIDIARDIGKLPLTISISIKNK